jgi:large subunit ribosomal protein L1
MGKKRMAVLGSTEEEASKSKKAVKLEQKKLREGKVAKAPGLKGGQRVIDTASESLKELEIIEAKNAIASPETSPETPASSGKKRVHHRSRAYQTAKAKVDVDKTYPLTKALDLLRIVSMAKFDPAVELHITLKEKGFSKEIELPHATGKTRRIAIADDTTISAIEAGKIDFDVLLTTPAQMPKLVKFAKVLGPRGLMPNPKAGTVVPNPEAVAKTMSSKNTLSLKTEKDAPLIHLSLGKLSFKDEILIKNLSAVLSVLPPNQVRKIVLKSSISPAIKVQS